MMRHALHVVSAQHHLMFSFLEIAPWGGGRLRGGFLENTVRFIQIYFYTFRSKINDLIFLVSFRCPANKMHNCSSP
jgi:hypothetical protein